MASPDQLQLLRLYQKAAPPSFFQELCEEHGYEFRQGVYSVAVVVWLMIWQRLQGDRGLAAAVQYLIHGGAGDLVVDCKRWTDDQVSSATGGYCQARQKLPKLIASQVSEGIVEQLQTEMQEGWKGLQRPVFVIDGSTLQLQHEPELVKAFSRWAQSTWGESLAGDADRGVPRCVQWTSAAAGLGSDVWRYGRERASVGRTGVGKAAGGCGGAGRRQFWDFRLRLCGATEPTANDLAADPGPRAEDLRERVGGRHGPQRSLPSYSM